MKERNNGITLILLVITIVILLVLVGIAILQLLENGLLEKTKIAKEKSVNAQIEENETLDTYENLINKYISNSRDLNSMTVDELTKLITTLIKKELNSTSNGDTTPTGTVISYMGNTAPNGYLFCDGNVYNISDYKHLADQIKNEFGSFNYFGGDGISTFAVPNLSDGRYLKGSTTAGINQNAGLPNITGSTSSCVFGGSPQGTTGSGALRRIYTRRKKLLYKWDFNQWMVYNRI